MRQELRRSSFAVGAEQKSKTRFRFFEATPRGNVFRIAKNMTPLDIFPTYDTNVAKLKNPKNKPNHPVLQCHQVERREWLKIDA